MYPALKIISQSFSTSLTENSIKIQKIQTQKQQNIHGQVQTVLSVLLEQNRTSVKPWKW